MAPKFPALVSILQQFYCGLRGCNVIVIFWMLLLYYFIYLKSSSVLCSILIISL